MLLLLRRYALRELEVVLLWRDVPEPACGPSALRLEEVLAYRPLPELCRQVRCDPLAYGLVPQARREVPARSEVLLLLAGAVEESAVAAVARQVLEVVAEDDGVLQRVRRGGGGCSGGGGVG